MASSEKNLDHPLTFTVGQEQLVIRRRYELRLAAHIHLRRLPESEWH